MQPRSAKRSSQRRRKPTAGARRPSRRRGPNRRKPDPLWKRLPKPRAIADACKRGLRRAAPGLAIASVIAGVCAGSYFGYRWLLTSERFALDQVDVRGNDRLTGDGVRAALGAAPGDNLFRLDLSQLERNLERHPWIAEAHVERRLPSSLRVLIKEQVAVAVVDLGGLYLADARGQAFKKTAIASGEGRGLPVITGLSRRDYITATEATQQRIRDALAIADAYRAKSDRPALGEIHLDPRRGVTLFTYDTALSIRVGHNTGSGLATMLAAFDTAWRSLTAEERKTATRVHVDNAGRPDRITVAFAQTH